MKMNNFLLALILVGCGAKQSDWSWSGLKHPIVYIEACTNKGTGSPPYGDIFVLDAKTKTRHRITDDSYYDETPRWSCDGRYIVFLTSREGSDRSLAIGGVSAPRQLYLFDTRTELMRRLPVSLERLCGRSDLHGMWSADWTYRNQVIVTDGRKGLFQVDPTNGQCCQVAALSGFDYVSGFVASPRGMEIAISTIRTKAENPGFDQVDALAIWSVKDSTLTTVVDSASGIIIMGWSEDSRDLYCKMNRKLFKFDIELHTSAAIDLPKKVLNQAGTAYQFMSNGDIIFMEGREKSPTGADELMLYRFANDTLESLTNSGLEKQSLSVFRGTAGTN